MVAIVSDQRKAGDSLRIVAGLGAGAMVVGGAGVWYFDPSRASFFPACPLYATTGFACPGCGMTRGFHALFHGDVLTALDFNALIPVAVLFFGYIFFSLISVAMRGRGLLLGNWNLVLLWGTFGLLVVFGILPQSAVLSIHDLVPLKVKESKSEKVKK